MGRKKEKREAFFREHPTCCFCGGKTPAVEMDHVPSRELFNGRSWPEGFVFPACSRCNRTTSHSELVVAFLSRIYPDVEPGSPEEAQMRKILTAINNNIPGCIEEMTPSSKQARAAERDYGLRRSPGAFLSQVPILNVGGPIVERSMMEFGRKLFTALHYRQTGRVLPPDGGIAVKWWSNTQILDGEIPEDIARMLATHPPLTRGKSDLSDQFQFQRVYDPDGSIGAYLAYFRQSFAILGYVRDDVAKLDGFPKDAIVRPFSW